MTTVSSYDDNMVMAGSLLIAYAALSGMCAFFVLIIGIISLPPEASTCWMFIASLLVCVVLSVLAWAIPAKKPWAWIPAAIFAAGFVPVFPIGTLISYYSLTALWRCRKHFYPFCIQK
jgi:hypothetical protein